jgi:SAM-dependent methyltransferase
MQKVRQLHKEGYSVADELLTGLMCIGWQVNPGAKVLDFGCGAGGLVYDFRVRGYDAYGFDIHNYVSLRDREDSKYFAFVPTGTADTSDMRMDSDKFNLPFENDMFDLVVSTSVLEHVLDWGPAMREFARVLTPKGVGLHLFPGKKALIEPHMMVPLASRIQSWWWFYVWALAGVRNQYQTTFSAKETADRNFRYSNTGVRYRTDSEMRNAGWPYFSSIYFVDERFHAVSTWRDGLRNLRLALGSPSRIQGIAALPKHRALFMTDKRPVEPSDSCP